MNPSIPIAPTELRDFAKVKGWSLVREAAKDRLYVMTNPHFAGRQLVFPMDTTAPDYFEAVVLTVEKLAAMEQRSIEDIFKSLIECGDDGISFRFTTPRADGYSLPLSFAGFVVSGAQQLLLASAHTVLKPQAHHPRLSRSEALQILDAAKFRHTTPGSFILNVSCPVHALDVQTPLFSDEFNAPFVRQTTVTLQQTLRELVTSIETDTLDELIAESKAGKGVVVSSNLCEALGRFEDESMRNSVEIGIAWAASIPIPKGEPPVSKIRIQNDYFPRIDEVRRELRSHEQHLEDLFPGTVERLDGEMGKDGQRSGDVILSLLSPDGEQVRARANLDAEQYVKADRAHMTDGAFILVRGRLHPGRQPRQLTAITSFELMSIG